MGVSAGPSQAVAAGSPPVQVTLRQKETEWVGGGSERRVVCVGGGQWAAKRSWEWSASLPLGDCGFKALVPVFSEIFVGLELSKSH